ncbi:hypothetical protein [Neptuniibacter sp. CAU 1671]|uniref:hypothetical protein n=1 Tax=Neptuniibacter sp. CAU 1671 TaxID=3032593 RepID=UPI0023DB3CF7|nr:hypothetical protein [Neptuniibacter sp. CAU 1671]MDF2181862.1 hypothetical protein [Neptuniibacter sp. CAU 1671]
MPQKIKSWTPDQLKKMNQSGFMVDMLDTFKFSPEIRDDDTAIDTMVETLTRVESDIGKSE